VWGQLFHLYSTAVRYSLCAACLCLAFLALGCGEPPDKEMGQAQGAIDAARAAGADRYAVTEFTAATGALARSRQAVTERDYRLALNDALESLEHAQNAAREAAETKARLGAEVERLIIEVNALRAEAERLTTAAADARAPREALRPQQEALALATTDLQEANADAAAGDLTAASASLAGTKQQLTAIVAALDALVTAQAPRRRR